MRQAFGFDESCLLKWLIALGGVVRDHISP